MSNLPAKRRHEDAVAKDTAEVGKSEQEETRIRRSLGDITNTSNAVGAVEERDKLGCERAVVPPTALLQERVEVAQVIPTIVPIQSLPLDAITIVPVAFAITSASNANIPMAVPARVEPDGVTVPHRVQRPYMRRDADNIDARDGQNPLQCTAYVHDMYELFYEQERALQVSPSYMEVQPYVNERMRAILVDWLVRASV